MHAGRYGGIDNGFCVVPSVVPQTLPHFRPPCEMSKEDIKLCIKEHADAARRAVKAEGNIMQVWEVQETGMAVTIQPFPGFRSVDVDLLFVLDESALNTLYRELKNNALVEFKNLIRQGKILFYILKSRDQLDEMGYEELIDRLDIPWLGTCH
ncbi:MAG: hypothetical protein A4E53_03970 [Pelotomaculum sp. PtaB.Bin104]|nr:MAG: hypothetical protein A4E53_03970 [Pelotomaculum sp. PtaB.Bin104]